MSYAVCYIPYENFMKKIIVFCVIFSLFFPFVSRSETIPGSVGEAIEQDSSFTFPEDTTEEGVPVPVQDEFYRGKIERIINAYTSPGYGPGTEAYIQELEVRLISGPESGTVLNVINEIAENNRDTRELHEGDLIVVGKSIIGAETQYYITDVYRLNALWIILSAFVIIVLLLTRLHGIRAFLGLGISFLVIVWFIVPRILAGDNPIMISLIGTAVIAATSIYVAHGFYRRTTIAFLGTMISIALALTLSYILVTITQLFGMGTEEAFYLQFAPGASINLQGLLLGGIIIGVLGILDDITTAQAAVVEQIHYANPELGAVELYKRASLVGREHILSLVNTLVLAYTGASLPLLLLFKVYERPAWMTLNSEIIMEEVIRMLIGSITLILAVPITTFLAARYYSKMKQKNTAKKIAAPTHTH